MKDEIESLLETKWAGHPLLYLPTTASTNEDVKKLMEEGEKEGVLVVSGEQTAGRGRRGREWSSPADSNIYMSLGLRPDYPADTAPMMTLITAMAVADALDKVIDKEVNIKWPNDVIAGGKKICGILTEMSVKEGCVQYAVIGTGINVNVPFFDGELRKSATSVLIETGKKADRAALIADTMKAFEIYYGEFIKTGDLSNIRDIYEKRLVNIGKPVRVLDPCGEYDGIALGIDDKGELLVQKENGETVNVYAGEVSVRGVYGYI